MPASITPSSAMMAVSVRVACLTAGSRKAVTPLLTASTPVIAVHPLAKARIKIQSDAAIAAGGCGAGGSTGTGRPPRAVLLTTPMARTRQQRNDEQVRGEHEREARLAHPAQIDQRDHGQDHKA